MQLSSFHETAFPLRQSAKFRSATPPRLQWAIVGQDHRKVTSRKTIVPFSLLGHNHPELLTGPRILHGCRFRTIMSSRTSLACGVLGSEQCGLAGVPDDHEQSGAVVMGAGAS
jgi:hypothetical protein